jgi:hypothetical protein
MQASVEASESSIAISLMMFTQYLGSAIFLTVSNTIFNQDIPGQLAAHAPNVNAEAIIKAGATAFRSFVSPEDLPGVLLAYSNSVDKTFYVAAAAGVGAFVSAWAMGWTDLRKKNVDAPAASKAANGESKKNDGDKMV